LIKSANPNHPKKGSTIKVEPIRDLDAIRQIKELLADKPRDLCLFTFGINTAYRASEILSLNIGDVRHLTTGDRLDVKQSKTKKYRAVTLNHIVIGAIQAWIDVHPEKKNDGAALFYSQKSKKALLVPTVTNMLKHWCSQTKLDGNYDSHNMRKTWGYHQRNINKSSTSLLMVAFGHESEKQTLSYLCIQEKEVTVLFDMEL